MSVVCKIVRHDIKTNKITCKYCDNNEVENFECVDCGAGMCEECYDNQCEHTEQTFDFSEMDLDDSVYNRIVKKTGHTYGYLCYSCIPEEEEIKNDL